MVGHTAVWRAFRPITIEETIGQVERDLGFKRL
jgi:hypothetical protein